MNAVVLGDGFLGREFGGTVEVLGRDKFCFGEELVRFEEQMDYIAESLKLYNVVINCIGKADTRWCEKNPEAGRRVNCEFALVLKEYCRRMRKKLVSISSGCVYGDVQNAPAIESAFTIAYCEYTYEKIYADSFMIEGELIIRPRLLFGVGGGNRNFLNRIAKFKTHLSDKKDSLTSTTSVVEAVMNLLYQKKSGIYNVAQDGFASIAEIAGWLGLEVKPALSEDICEEQELKLVNTKMDISKLKKVWKPSKLREEIMCMKVGNSYIKELE